LGKKDAVSLLAGYRAYGGFKQKDEEAKRQRSDALKRSAVPQKSLGGTGAPSTPPVMDEEAAFKARLKEIEKEGLRLQA
jgi:hypothetical protein